MKLYEIPRNSYIKVGDEVFHFHHVDGMYSVCYNKDMKVVHLNASTEVEIVTQHEFNKK